MNRYSPYRQPYPPPAQPYYHIPYYFQYPYTYYNPYRPLPPVDTKMFIKSAKCVQTLMSSATVIVNKFASSHRFAYDIMNAAQYSNMNEVEKLLNTLGTKDKPKISYTPDGINIEFNTDEDEVNICHLTIKIRWG